MCPAHIIHTLRVTLYRYGAIAWFWRALIVFGLVLGAVFVAASVRMPSALMMVAAFALIGPALFFGTALVVRADQCADGTLEIWTLLFWRRRIDPSRLRPPVARILYRTIHANLNAPRVWVPVKGAPPLYFDLLGQIVNRQALLAAIRLRADTLRRAP